MKTNNLELELKRFEVSAWNDKITYEKHSYNGFSGMEGTGSYNNYLDELYNDYFFNFRQKIDALITDKDTLIPVINDKITLFEGIKDDYLLKNNMYNHYDSYIQTHYQDMIGGNNSIGLKNDYGTLQFQKEMSHTQMYYIEKAIDEFKKMLANYSPFTNKNIINENIEQAPITDTMTKFVDDVLTRAEACEYLKIKDRKLTTLLNTHKINPITWTCKPYTFAKKELERYINQNIED